MNSRSKFRFSSALVLAFLLGMLTAQPSLATAQITYPATANTFELEVEAADGVGTVFLNNLDRIELPVVDNSTTATYRFELIASESNAIINPTTEAFTCWFYDGATQRTTSGRFEIVTISTGTTTTVCDLIVTGPAGSSEVTEFRVGSLDIAGEYARVGVTLVAPSLTVTTLPTLTMGSDGAISFTSAVWSSGATPTGTIHACASSHAAIPQPISASLGSCTRLYANSMGTGNPTNWETAWWNDVSLVNGQPMNNWRMYKDGLVDSRPYIVYQENTQGNYIHTSTVEVVSAQSSDTSSEDEVPPPVYFGGPLIQGSTLPHFTQGEEGTVTLTGKRLNKITSATINGVAVTVTADRRSATITVPATLAAGTYDLVLQTTNGRLTVTRFIKVS